MNALFYGHNWNLLIQFNPINSPISKSKKAEFECCTSSSILVCTKEEKLSLWKYYLVSKKGDWWKK